MFLLTNTRCNNYKKYNIYIYIYICWCSFDLHVLALIIKVHRPTGKVAILYINIMLFLQTNVRNN